MSFLRARMTNEVQKGQTAKVRLEKMKAEVIDRARTTVMAFDPARRERDAWLNWPTRVAANMAAELGVDALRMEQVLGIYLRQHLTEMAEVKIEPPLKPLMARKRSAARRWPVLRPIRP